jgi:hypothetical protein
LAAFRESLSLLVGRIRLALASRALDSENGVDAAMASSTYREILLRLNDALLAEIVGKADALLEELGAMPIGLKTKEAFSTVADLVLTSKFKDAVNMIDGLIKE